MTGFVQGRPDRRPVLVMSSTGAPRIVPATLPPLRRYSQTIICIMPRLIALPGPPDRPAIGPSLARVVLMATVEVLGPGAGHILTARGSSMAFKAVAAQTGGDFSLMERTLPAHGRR